ncbi:MAG: hypothetical protein LLG00_05545 [Planctomycetaceae bacterium]|nr:hypothetical protein [Planctomycetaceae bacterium]
MRCIVGLVLFVVLYVGSCGLLGKVVADWALRNGQAYSQRDAIQAGHRAIRKYHPHVAVGVGLVTLLICAAPTLLAKRDARKPSWQ